MAYKKPVKNAGSRSPTWVRSKPDWIPGPYSNIFPNIFSQGSALTILNTRNEQLSFKIRFGISLCR